MRKFDAALMSVVLAAGTALFAGVAAAAYTAKVRQACAGDYQNFCAQYSPESVELRRCIESNRKGLTHNCVTALIDAGEVPAKYLKK
ncbi:hypothetical protein [Hyphomicrobium sp. ghe19]|uniref:hypothetical protein n=1 Tax=Hyphomicrobium sp. ghe19 TaxID=2682968 RepID=UPI0013678F26|nr:hypothetical protein HYPP_03158 [Hyphomicrobium sp. ghe19]